MKPVKDCAYACIHTYVRLSKAQEEALLKLDYVDWMTHKESGIFGPTLYALVKKGVVTRYYYPRKWSVPVYRIAPNVSIMSCRTGEDNETI